MDNAKELEQGPSGMTISTDPSNKSFRSSSNSCVKGSLHELLQPGKSSSRVSPASVPASAEPGSGDGAGANKAPEKAWKTLAFPSISTLDFRFDHSRAAPIIVETVSSFLSSEESAGLRLAMIDIRPDMLSRVRELLEKSGVDPERFLVVQGDITKLHSRRGLECSAISNAANSYLKVEGTGGVNLAIYRAAGGLFEEATKRCAKNLTPGNVVSVPLPESSPLRREKVTHVIHVLGPNMNPKRPYYLANDYNEGCRLLQAAYSNLFSAFAAIAKGQQV